MRLLFGIALLLLTAAPILQVHGAGPAQEETCAPPHSIVDYPPYRDLLCRGLAKLAVGLPGEALADFEAASRIHLHEIPNFEINTYLAHAQLQLGDKDAYLESIRKSELSLLVWSGIYYCSHARPQPLLLDEVSLPIATPEADAIAARMCGDTYTSYYEPGSRTIESIATEGRLAEYHLQVRRLIEQREAMAEAVR